jgi:large subunit ribosomal protein L31
MTVPGCQPESFPAHSSASTSISAKLRSTAPEGSKTAASEPRLWSVRAHLSTIPLFFVALRIGLSSFYLPFRPMKAEIHPNYVETSVSCACGTVYHVGSTRRDLKIGICAACHPFFTGEQKFVDTAGRVEKFARRFGSTKAIRAVKKTAA